MNDSYIIARAISCRLHFLGMAEAWTATLDNAEEWPLDQRESCFQMARKMQGIMLLKSSIPQTAPAEGGTTEAQPNETESTAGSTPAPTGKRDYKLNDKPQRKAAEVAPDEVPF